MGNDPYLHSEFVDAPKVLFGLSAAIFEKFDEVAAACPSDGEVFESVPPWHL